MSKLRTLVVGGAGSLGRMLTQRLLSSSSVWVLDRADIPTRIGGLRSLAADLRNLEVFEQVDEELDGDIHLFYLAASLSNDLTPSGVNAALQDNVIAVANTVSALKERLRFVTFVSSVSVYGPTATCPVPESAEVSPNTLYGLGKALGETTVASLCSTYGVPFAIFRPTQLFGLKSTAATLPHLLVTRMSQGLTCQLRVSPRLCRDYLMAGDLVDLLAKQLMRQEQGIFNVGSGGHVALGDLFRVASERFGVPFEVLPEDTERKDGFDQYLDVRLVQERFGFKPSIGVLEWMRTVDPQRPYMEQT